MTDEDRIAELGQPKLGENERVKVVIVESQELRGVVDQMMKNANQTTMLGTSSWKEQFVEAISLPKAEIDEEEEEKGGVGGDSGEGSNEKGGEIDSIDYLDGTGEEIVPTWLDYVMHFLCLPWKILFAFIPPTDYFGGWICFVVSIAGIGVLTALVGDLASHFGCTIGLKDAVTAITFVALGTSIPDTFASKVAAIQDKYADSSIGNVTGSNAVNVFLGIGLAWTIASVYHEMNGGEFHVPPGTLAFSVTIFIIEAFLVVFILLIRRLPAFGGGELGGPAKFKITTTLIFAFLWIVYVGLSTLESYCVIQGF